MLTVTGPAEVNVQDRVEVPVPPVMVAGVRVQAELLEVRPTLPVNPFRGEIVMVEVPGAPVSTVTAVGLATIEKSAGTATVKVTVAVCERVPLVPVTVTTSVPAVANVHDRVEVPDPVTLVGFNEQTVLLAVRPTAPVKPF